MTTLSQQQGVQTIPTRRKLGDILTAAGVITEAQLQNALGHQRQWGGRLGHILIDLRVIDEATLARTLAEQLGILLVDLDTLALSVDLARLLPQSIAERHGVFPVIYETAAARLTVAFSDPTNLAAVDEVRFQTGKVIQVAVAGEGQIATAIRRFYYGEDPAALEQPAEPATLFGNVSGFLAGEEELTELEPLEPLPDASPALASDPLTGFLGDEADPAEQPIPPAHAEPEAVSDRADTGADFMQPDGGAAESILDEAVDLTRKTVVGVYTPVDLSVPDPEPTNPQIEMAHFLAQQELTRPDVALADLLGLETPVHGQAAPAPGLVTRFASAPRAAEIPPAAPGDFSREARAASVAAAGALDAGAGDPPGFSDDDLGAALAGLERSRPITDEWQGTPHAAGAPAEVPTDGHFAQALARLLIRKGLIDEAELLAEIAQSQPPE